MLFNVFWKMKHYGKSQHEAKNESEIRHLANEGELITDFGDPDEFDDLYDIDSGWEIDYIE